jgi:hypothetical protein
VGGHAYDPLGESWRRERDGQRASLLEAYDYPVIATCRYCRRLIRSENFIAPWLLADRPEEGKYRAQEDQQECAAGVAPDCKQSPQNTPARSG